MQQWDCFIAAFIAYYVLAVSVSENTILR